MRVTIIGKTNAVLSLNKVGIQIQGKISAKDIQLNTEEKRREVLGLERIGLVDVIYHDEIKERSNNVVKAEVKTEPEVARRRGRPKKNQDTEVKENKTITLPLTKELKREQKRVAAAEAETQKENSRVIVSTGDRTIETRMAKNIAGEIAETEATKASIEAMNKLEQDEKDNQIDDIPPVNEEKRPPQEQMGRGAVVIEEGAKKNIDMVNSIINGSNEIKSRDPFIDKEEVEAEETEEKEVVKKIKPVGEIKIIDENSNNDIDDIDDLFAPEPEQDGDSDYFIE